MSQRQVTTVDSLADLDIVKITSCAALSGHESGSKAGGMAVPEQVARFLSGAFRPPKSSLRTPVNVTEIGIPLYINSLLLRHRT